MEALKTYRVYSTQEHQPIMQLAALYYEIDRDGNLNFYIAEEKGARPSATFANMLWWGVEEWKR